MHGTCSSGVRRTAYVVSAVCKPTVRRSVVQHAVVSNLQQLMHRRCSSAATEHAAAGAAVTGRCPASGVVSA
jgi:hypothetical protein